MKVEKMKLEEIKFNSILCQESLDEIKGGRGLYIIIDTSKKKSGG